MTLSHRLAVTALLIPLLATTGCIRKSRSAADSAPQLETAESNDPASSESTTEEISSDPAMDPADLKVTRAKVTTDAGEFIIEVHPEWAPNGAAHWLKLVKMGFYDDTRFFRAIDGFMAQTGISGDPAKTKQWGDQTIPDDKVAASNKRGYVTFAQTGRPNSRSTQWFINFGDNSNLDTMNQGFMPFGKVVEGMNVVDKINTQYGENPGDTQMRAEAEGNAFLDERFPGLTKIIKIEIVDGGEAEASEATEETSAEAKPEEEKPKEEAAAEEKKPEMKEEASETKPAEEKPEESKPAEEKAAEEKPEMKKETAEEKPAEEPAEAKPAEEKPAEPKEADPKPSEEKPASEEAKSEEPKAEEPASEETKSEEPKSEEPAPEN